MPVVAASDLPKEYKVAAYQNAINTVKELMVQQGIVNSPDDVAIRELLVGDAANAADFVDLGVKTPVATGQEGWGEDAADLTNYAFSNILETNAKVPDNKVIVFFGFTDLTADPDLVAIKFVRGSDTLDIWEVEHCYKSSEEVGGFSFTTDSESGELVPYCVSYGQNDPISIQMIFRDGSADKKVVLHALIGERYGDRISKS